MPSLNYADQKTAYFKNLQKQLASSNGCLQIVGHAGDHSDITSLYPELANIKNRISIELYTKEHLNKTTLQNIHDTTYDLPANYQKNAPLTSPYYLLLKLPETTKSKPNILRSFSTPEELQTLIDNLVNIYVLNDKPKKRGHKEYADMYDLYGKPSQAKIDVNQFKKEYLKHNPDGHYFDSKSMQAWGDTLHNFAVRDGGNTWDLFRKNDVQTSQGSTYSIQKAGYCASFSKDTFKFLGDIKKYEYKPSLASSPPTEQKAETLSETYIEQIQNYLINTFSKKTSVLLKERKGVDYSVNSETNKPLSGINQFFLQQVRNDNNYKSPYFVPTKDTLQVKGKNKSIILAISDTNRKTPTPRFFYNFDQLYNTTSPKLKAIHQPLTIPEPNLPSVKDVIKDDLLLTDTLSKILSHSFATYLNSIYSGAEYTPSPVLKDYMTKISENLRSHAIPIFPVLKNGWELYQKTHKNSITQKNKRSRSALTEEELQIRQRTQGHKKGRGR